MPGFLRFPAVVETVAAGFLFTPDRPAGRFVGHRRLVKYQAGWVPGGEIELSPQFLVNLP